MSAQLPLFSPTTSEATDSAISSPASADGRSRSGSLGGPTTAPSGLAPAPANLSREPANEPGSPTSAISGQSSCGSSASASLQLYLGSRLRARLAGRGSPLYVLTWKEWSMPLGPPICALRASVIPRSGSGSSGWQTPTTRDGKGESGKGNRIKRGKNGRLHVANLCDQLVDLGRRDLVTSTSFRCWLMGYPESWEVARATAMQSFRKSRRSS